MSIPLKLEFPNLHDVNPRLQEVAAFPEVWQPGVDT